MKRQPANLSESLSHRLNAYALAASAAGVSLLALSQHAEARIVYKAAHVKIGHGGLRLYDLDVNHDGHTDFKIGTHSSRHSSTHGSVLSVLVSAHALRKNGIAGSWTSDGYTLAYPFVRGREIGPSQVFRANRIAGIWVVDQSFSDDTGDWCNRTRFLGLKLRIEGHTHFSWARFNVNCSTGNLIHPKITALLTGYAYETIPNKPIIAGKTKGPDVVTVQAPSLGHLARGASAIPAWRTKP